MDGTFVTIGSTNFDQRSLRWNDEINLTVYEGETDHRLEEVSANDPGRSAPTSASSANSARSRRGLLELLVMPLRSDL